ncbi:MAG TPA: 30S ribosomal protein S20 [Anaeromyxobacteraceae bacterium]|nr:30S ribosomal protein S20 [Anaeromyxobacteraceae bacterium]
MANTRSAEKRNRQAQKRRLRNQTVRSRVKTAVKKLREAVERGEKGPAAEALKVAARVIEKAASKGVVHGNTASRKISRLARSVAKLEPAK